MSNYTRFVAVILASMLFWGTAAAAVTDSVPQIREDAPLRYVVQPGDTLWDISGYFLRDPFLWPEIWYSNPDIGNPHLIYPGDVLYLVWVDGRPMLSREPPMPSDVVKLSPKIREQALDQAIPTIPLDAIQAFLNGPRIVDKAELDRAPYVVEFKDEHMIGGRWEEFYAKGVMKQREQAFQLVREGQIYVDPDSKEREELGQEVTPVGAASVERLEEPALMRPSAATREVLRGDRLLPHEEAFTDTNFYPTAPDFELDAAVMAVQEGVTQIGRYQIITLNKGAAVGLKPGHVLDIYTAGREVADPYPKYDNDKRGFPYGPNKNRGVPPQPPTVSIPPEMAGRMMVFKTYERISYGLVMEAKRAFAVGARARNPVVSK